MEDDVIHKGTPSQAGVHRTYEESLLRRRGEILERVRQGYEHWKQTGVYGVPQWLYGPPKGKLFQVACEDVPGFGDTSYLEFDAGRTALVSIDWQVDFCGEHGYVDVMGYSLDNTANPLKYAARALRDARLAGLLVLHCREGHVPDLSDCPYNKILRSKIIGKNAVGIGETPAGGLGPLLVRGSLSWGIVKEVEPVSGELIVDKAGKGAALVSDFFLTLQNAGITHLILCGITTDVCVHTIMRQANDLGYWCMLLKDATGATDMGNHEAAIKMVKMQGGVFGWVSDSVRLHAGLSAAGLIE
ncbi:MAG: cysteine hydrolase family protein [Pigmentiphaga sp.]|uniref:cysteine hydrolase family protein n=1 Tax=Pigmentiphaga sp. TaxID=1977564 RepID=UPI003B576AB5